MGRREWEKGEMKFGAKEFSQFRKGLVTGLNEHHEKLLKVAQEIHASLTAAAPQERDLSLDKRIEKHLRLVMDKRARPRSYGFGLPSPPEFSQSDEWLIRVALLKRPEEGEMYQLKRPSPSASAFAQQPLPEVGHPTRKLVRAQNQKKKALLGLAKAVYDRVEKDPSNQPLSHKVFQAWNSLGFASGETASEYQTVKNALIVVRPPTLRFPTRKFFPIYNGQTTSFASGECSLTLQPETRQARWEVDQSKNAVRDAWDSALGRVLHRLLETTHWPRGASAEFWGGDEYHDEANEDRPGGDISYITRSYPKKPFSSTPSRRFR